MRLILRLSGLGILFLSPAARAYSPEAEAALEILRDRISSGLAGQEAYDALLDLLAEGGDGGCEAWRELPELREAGFPDAEPRWRDVREALAEACPEPPGAEGGGRRGGEGSQGNLQDTLDALPPPGPGAGKGRGAPRARLLAAQSVRPRQDPGAGAPAPLFQGEGSLPGAAARLSLRDYRPYLRYASLGNGRFSVHAGHLHASLTDTRLAFVAGNRFYAGWSGTSGADGAFFSPQAALDGLGLRGRAGAWTLEAAGTWNRLQRGGSAAGERRDASLFTAGLARRGSRSDFRLQTAFQRFEPASGAPMEVKVAGAGLQGRGEDGILWKLGAAGSWTHSPSRNAAVGAYLDAFLSARDPDSGGWRLQARQASAAWANPLQSPRGYLRDTLEGRWILPGRGEGGLSVRSRLPVVSLAGFRADVQGSGAAGWSLNRGLLAGEGGLAWIQTLEEWTHEAGSTVAFRRPGPPGSMGLPHDGEDGGWGGWGQSLTRRSGPWLAKAAFTWKGGGYSGSRPAPLSLTCERKGTAAWAAEILAGDVRKPGRYLRLDVRHGWWAEKGVKVEQTLRLPWTREGAASDMGYQLRLVAAL